MEISRIKNLKKSESAVLIYLMVKGLCKARFISSNLEININNLYKILKSLEDKDLIIKLNEKNYEYKAREDLVLK